MKTKCQVILSVLVFILFTQTILIQAQPCTYNSQIQDGLNSDQMANQHIDLNDQLGAANAIFVEGRFYITSDISFTDCHIIMATDAEIIIQGDNSLVLDHCWINTCSGNTMWKGIKVEGSGATLALSIDGCVIERAENLINATHSNNISVINSNLNKNFNNIVLTGDWITYPYIGTFFPAST